MIFDSVMLDQKSVYSTICMIRFVDRIGMVLNMMLN